jgi:hypothetical protein
MAKSLTSLLFQAARLSADGRAIRKGPAAIAKRVVRKQVIKSTNVPLNQLLRKILG